MGTAQIADASIIDAKIVSLNAEVISSGTLSTERLIIKGANGLIYEINAQASGLSMTELSEEKYQNQLNGTVIVARSITANQIGSAFQVAFMQNLSSKRNIKNGGLYARRSLSKKVAISGLF